MQALAKLRVMQQEGGVAPDKVSYASVIAACQRAQKDSQALALLDEVRFQHWKLHWKPH